MVSNVSAMDEYVCGCDYEERKKKKVGNKERMIGNGT